MKGLNGELWVAYIDEDKVRYFTTQKEYKARLPETISKWRGNFSEKPVVFMDTVNRFPDEFGNLNDPEPVTESESRQ